MVRNIVQLWVRLRCLCDHLWHQRMLPDGLTWQQRWQHFGIFHLIRCYNYNCLSCWIASPGVNDRQKGHTDEYTGESVLGTCFLFNLGKPSAIEVIFPNVFENCNGISVQTFGHWGHDWWWWNVANVFDVWGLQWLNCSGAPRWSWCLVRWVYSGFFSILVSSGFF